MTKSYDFVPFLSYIPYNGEKTEHKNGKIPIKIKTLTPIHISSGEYAVSDSNIIYREFVRVKDIPVIPGTSFKGCIRSIAESISYSYPYIIEEKRMKSIPEFKLKEDNDLKQHIKNNKKDKEGIIKCIVCDMFGQMGQKSKIMFSDLKAVPGKYKLEIRGIPQSFRPNPGNEYYFEEGKYKGYKFYRHGINGIQPEGKVYCEFITENSYFEGEIIYRDLTEVQIQLLCFSLGLSSDISPKIGYGKNYYFGSIEVSSDEKWTEKAKQYKIGAPDDIRKNIEILCSILNFKNAVHSL